MSKAMRELTFWLILGFLIVAALTGCSVEPPLRDQVRAICGAPAKDLSNVNNYATCVYTVLDIHAEQQNNGYVADEEYAGE